MIATAGSGWVKECLQLQGNELLREAQISRDTYKFFVNVQYLSELLPGNFSPVQDFIIRAFSIEILIDPIYIMISTRMTKEREDRRLTAGTVLKYTDLSHLTLRPAIFSLCG